MKTRKEMNVIIHYPDDEEMMNKIYKEIAAFRCSAILNHMEILGLTDKQKLLVLESLIDDIKQRKENTA